MRYSLRHVTSYRYGSPVTFAQCTLVLRPACDADQQVGDVVLDILPQPKVQSRHRSFFGHEVTVAAFDVPHRVLRIEARALVTVQRKPPAQDLFAQPWTATRTAAHGWSQIGSDAPVHFLFPSTRIVLDDRVTRYARESFTPQHSVIDGATDLMRRIRRDFRYDPDATRVSTPLIEAFDKRHGVCQDFAHVMIAGVRGLGLPARYVSGYIRTTPPPGQARLEGADATHAWVDVWCGQATGWVGFDPTNAILVGDDHVVLAWGRDYADVAPVGGVLLGAGDQTVDVNVDLVPLDDE